jgi:hypothetical protein
VLVLHSLLFAMIDSSLLRNRIKPSMFTHASSLPARAFAHALCGCVVCRYAAFLDLFSAMSRTTSFCASLFVVPGCGAMPRDVLVAMVRHVIERLTHCKGQWWRNLILKFARGGTTDDVRHRVDSILGETAQYIAARNEIKDRVAGLLASCPSQPALTERAAGDVEALWTLLLVQLCSDGVDKQVLPVRSPGPMDPRSPRCRHEHDTSVNLGISDETIAMCGAAAIAAIAAGAIDPVEFCKARGVHLAATFAGGESFRPPTRADSLLCRLLGHGNTWRSSVPTVGQALLDSHPEAMLRLILTTRSRLHSAPSAEPGGPLVNTRAITWPARPDSDAVDDDAFARVCALTAEDPACGPPFDSATQVVLRECAKAPERLKVRWNDKGQAVPCDFESGGAWTHMYVVLVCKQQHDASVSVCSLLLRSIRIAKI